MNDMEKTMAEWLAHPMEFDQPPIEIAEIHREKSEWPLFDEPVEVAFHRYKMDSGFVGVGMTGPITWSFIGDGMDGFSPDELKRLYAGWYVAFLTVNSEKYSAKDDEKEQKALAKKLKKDLPDFVELKEYLRVGELIFYAYASERVGAKITTAIYADERLEYEADSKYLRLPPLYYFIGSLFFDGKL
jgi:hypothetical protein